MLSAAAPPVARSSGLCGLGDGHGTLLQWPRCLWLPQVPQDLGEVVQGGGDSGVVGLVGGLVDGQGPFLQGPRRLQLPEVLQDQGEVVQVGGDVGVVVSVLVTW